MSSTEWAGLAVVILLAVAWYLSYSAARLDRLHARVEGTLAALDAQLVRRAEATLELANGEVLDPATALMLAGAATDSLAAAEQHSTDSQAQSFTTDRGTVESDLSDALALALTPEAVATLRSEGEFAEDALDRVQTAGQRVQLARRFHNDAVTDVRRVRRKFTVRTFRLAGHAAMPRTVDFDDVLPEGLRD